MRFRPVRGFVSVAALSLAAACGGGKGPDLDKIKEDFNNPSGSTADKNSLIAVGAKRDASGPAAGFAGGGVPGFGLTADGKLHALDKLAPRRLYDRSFRILQGQIQKQDVGSISREQLTGADDGCGQKEIQNAVLSIAQDGGGSASFNFTIDVAKCTGNAEATGTIGVNGEMSLSESKYSFTLEYTMKAVCEGGDAKACVNGYMTMEAEGTASGTSYNFNFTTGMDMLVTYTDAGKAREAHVKGGVRIQFDSSGAGKLEYLFYVNTNGGDEESFVLSLETDGQDNGKLKIKGRDGEVTCTFNGADNSGSCEGTGGTISWDAAEADVIEDGFSTEAADVESDFADVEIDAG